jgi:hypothetical protein
MGPIRDEAEAKNTSCPFKFNAELSDFVGRCEGSRCAAWQHLDEKKTHPVGFDPGPGWRKDGAVEGMGSSTTQSWLGGTKGGCARMGGHH